MRPSASLSLAFSLLGLLPYVSAHGYVQEVTLGETKYTGYLPYADPYIVPAPQRIIRKVPWNGPVTNLSLIDIQCNGYTAGRIATEPAPLVGKVAAGETVKFQWTSWPSNHYGPVSTYMARVPDGVDVTQWNPGTEAVWFKIHHEGRTSDGKWASVEVLNENGGAAFARIPPKLRPGQYIIRHEIIALHFAFEYPGAQVYPSCVQVEVSGEGDAFPTEFVSFPGAYTANTPGIVFDLYNGPTEYPIPGPPVWTGGDE
ncbi:hypothetical protein CC2G_002600 [Coprinopsis cinerea AmutBmut pab1-1]|nr:hypothetical protein CC2G_002600 [Coprinopsis cinerea AmutBmut pab1-1]